MGMYDHFRRKFAKDYERLINTDTSADIKVGTVGQLRFGKRFTEDGYPDLQELGIESLPLTPLGEPVDKLYTHSGDTEIDFRIKASGDPATDFLGESSAGFVAKFSKKWSYVVAVKGLRYQALDITQELLAQLQDLAEKKLLRASQEFVVGVWTAESVSWILSKQSETVFEVEASTNIDSLADLGITWRPKSNIAKVEWMQPSGTSGGSIPVFFKLARMRRNGQVRDRGVRQPQTQYNGNAHMYELIRASELFPEEESG